MTLVLTLIAFGLMIIVHEAGHLLAARAFKVSIETFSIGFGKPIFNKVINGINYRISWLPLGGYLRMKGENPDDPDIHDEGAYQSKAWWQRALIAFAGPFANLILALFLFVISFMLPQKLEDQVPVIQSATGRWTQIFVPGDSLTTVNGKSVRGFSDALSKLSPKTNNTLSLRREGRSIRLNIAASDVDSLISSLRPQAKAIVGDITPGYPAWRAGLREKDLITAIDSVQINDWYDMRERITESRDGDVLVSIQRGDSLLTRHIILEENVLYGSQKMIGVTQYMPVRYSESYSPVQALKIGSLSTLNMIIMNYYGLYKLIQKPETLKSNIGGPVMIVSMSQSIGQKGFSALLMFFAGISIMLLIMNLLPIPILDGGHIFFCLIEGIIKRPIPLRVQDIAQRIGFFILMFLMVYAFYADIEKLLLRLIHR
ncbi:MAG TPA: RIP metalloprotease RseP [Candidatus Cloacimonadota bacterium]|nr:RIP metalloprotease RseP [Candidatus Cloacimonadota bacterium]